MAYNEHQSLKILLWCVAIYHILIGLLGIFAKDTAVFIARSFFNFNLTLTPEMNWIINPLAAYILFFGVFMAVAAMDPVKYRNIIYAGVGLFALRVVQRIIFIIVAPEGLINQVDPVRNIIAIGIVAIIGIAMFVMAKKVK